MQYALNSLGYGVNRVIGVNVLNKNIYKKRRSNQQSRTKNPRAILDEAAKSFITSSCHLLCLLWSCPLLKPWLIK